MTLTKTATIEEKTDPGRQDYPMASGAVTLFEGGLSAFDTNGNVVLAADSAGFLFAGVNIKQVIQLAGGANGDNQMRVIPKGSGKWVRVKSQSALTQANIGDNVFMVDDEVVDTAATVQNIVAGVIRIVEDATFCFIEI